MPVREIRHARHPNQTLALDAAPPCCCLSLPTRPRASRCGSESVCLFRLLVYSPIDANTPSPVPPKRSKCYGSQLFRGRGGCRRYWHRHSCQDTRLNCCPISNAAADELTLSMLIGAVDNRIASTSVHASPPYDLILHNIGSDPQPFPDSFAARQKRPVPGGLWTVRNCKGKNPGKKWMGGEITIRRNPSVSISNSILPFFPESLC